MNSLRQITVKKAGWLLPFVMAIIGLIGCQTMPVSYSGQTVPSSKQVPLVQSGESSGEYTTEDLEITFKYLRNGNTLDISGNIYFGDRLKYSFLRIGDFHADVLFVDRAGRAMEAQGLITSAMSSSDDPVSFSRTMVIPPDGAAMSFSYSGTAVSDDPDELLGGGMYFSDYPAR